MPAESRQATPAHPGEGGKTQSQDQAAGLPTPAVSPVLPVLLRPLVSTCHLASGWVLVPAGNRPPPDASYILQSPRQSRFGGPVCGGVSWRG